MTYTAEGFNHFCYEAAGKFLQTAVVIDNEAIFCESACKLADQEIILAEVVEPPRGKLGGEKALSVEVGQGAESTSASEAENLGQNPVEPPDPRKNILKAKPLIDAFADRGVVCSIIRPELDEATAVSRAISLASVADIVVVDWALGKTGDETEGSRAKQIIKGIIEGDLKKLGRLRLIAVYTAEGNPGTILDDLFRHISSLVCPDKFTKDNASYAIQNRFSKIVVLLKPDAGSHIPRCPPVEFSALPDRLQNLFAELNRGLLPSVTLRAIAEIREGTHHLLAVLHKDFDPAVVGHRCLLPHPEDAEEFCEDLISDELRSILAQKKIGKNYASEVVNKKWLGGKIKLTAPHQYKSFFLSRDQAFSLVEKGQQAHKKILDEIRFDWLTRELAKNAELTDKVGNLVDLEIARMKIVADGRPAWDNYSIPEINEKMIPQLLNGKEAEGQQANLDFSRLCTLKREAFGLRKPVEGWTPRLTLGTILQIRNSEGDSFILCLQPRCDSVRLEEKDKVWNFPFLTLESSPSKFNIVVKGFGHDDKPIDKKLFFEPKPRNQVVHKFISISRDAIESIEEDGKFIFQDKDNNKFFWVADLKDFIAQKIADELSTRVGSVGFDEYEWLRRKAR